eukprot:Colp12_sorted_trinity150504_noHs@33154
MKSTFVCLLALQALIASAQLNIDHAHTPEGYVLTPSGYIHKSCVHDLGEVRVEEHKLKAQHNIVHLANGDQIEHDPCPYAMIPFKKDELFKTKVDAISYYSGWISYTGYQHTAEYGGMTSQWTVPAAPKSPVPLLTTLFFFNGMEEQLHNTSVIIQPVLQYGHSGCGGGSKWTFASYIVSGAGRAYCGKMYGAQTGDVIQGDMNRQGRTWTVVTKNLRTNQVSTVSSSSLKPLLFSCNVMEVIRAYSCGAYPADNGLAFKNVHVYDEEMKEIDMRGKWILYNTHNECGQSVSLAGDEIDITYKN